MANDVRAVANQVIAEAAKKDRPVTHLSLQKICFFAHGLYLANTDRELVEGEFEAWNYGPVHRVLYHALQPNRDQPITSAIERIDPITGERCGALCVSDRQDVKFISDVASFFVSFSAGQLVELSHAGGSPWSQIWEPAKQSPNIGMRIPNAIVKKFYKDVSFEN